MWAYALGAITVQGVYVDAEVVLRNLGPGSGTHAFGCTLEQAPNVVDGGRALQEWPARNPAGSGAQVSTPPARTPLSSRCLTNCSSGMAIILPFQSLLLPLLILDFLPELRCRFGVDRLQSLDGAEKFGVPFGFELETDILEGKFFQW